MELDLVVVQYLQEELRRWKTETTVDVRGEEHALVVFRRREEMPSRAPPLIPAQ